MTGKWSFFVAACVLGMCRTAVLARDYHVQAGASAGGNGDPGTPFALVRDGLQAAQPGDSVLIHAGSYVESSLPATRVATAALPISVRAADAARPVIDGSAGSTTSSIVYASGAHYVFRGLTLRNAHRSAFSLDGGTDFHIDDCWIHDSGGGAIYPYNGAKRLTLTGSRIWRNAQQNNPPTGAGGWPSAVNLSAEGDIIEGNSIYENFGEGLGVYGRGHRVERNRVHDNYSVDIYVNNVVDTVVEANRIQSQGIVAFYRAGGGAYAISLANESASDPLQLDNVLIRNNIVSGPRRRCLSQWNGFSGVSMHNVHIVGNTFACTASDYAFVLDPGVHTGSTVRGNLFWERSADHPLALVSGASGVSYDHNHWYGGNAALPAALVSASDGTGDPLLANPAWPSAAGLRPLPSSLLVDSAGSLGLSRDALRTPRPLGAADDMGAIEAGDLIWADEFDLVLP